MSERKAWPVTSTVASSSSLSFQSPTPEQHEEAWVQDMFRAGVTACLRSWSALRTAVEREWGGADSVVKAEDLRRNILQHLISTRPRAAGSSSWIFPPRSLDLLDLSDNLAIYMEEEFGVDLEDGSEQQVAQVLWRMYEEACQGRVTLIQQVLAQQTTLQTAISTQQPQAQDQFIEDDDDDEDGEDNQDDLLDQGDQDYGAMQDDHDDNDHNMDEEHDDTARRLEVPEHRGPTQDEAQPRMEMPVPAMDAARTLNHVEAFNAAEYADQYLFGPPRGVPKRPLDLKPVRQLGEAMEADRVAPPPVDEDGFAPVVSKKRNKAR